MKKSQGSRKAKAKKPIKFGVNVSRKLLVLLVAVVALAIIVLGWWGVRTLNAAQVQARADRINEIYASLELDKDQYQVDTVNIFGDKRPYEYDKDRSYSSVVTYNRGATVSDTMAELDAKVKAAGFEYFEEPYPGSVSKQYHYKSPKGEYVRVTVSSKPYDDAWRNSAIMNQSLPNLPDDFDTNQGPSNVTIKVNLDDNNE